MSDLFENKDLEQVELVEETDFSEDSTVFSAPLEHKRKEPKNNAKKKLLAIVASVLSVSILITGGILIKKLIPEKSTDTILSSQSSVNNINVVTGEAEQKDDFSTALSASTDDISRVTITNSCGEFLFLPVQSTSSVYWTLSGIDPDKTSSSEISSIVSAAANIYALRTVEKSAEECGLTNPITKVIVSKNDNSSYTLLVGDKSTDNLGSYVMVEGRNAVYVVGEDFLEPFEFDALSLSDKSAIPKTLFDSDTSDNQVADGTYAYFDSLTMSGKLYPETITINNNPGKTKTDEIVPYIITTPVKRYANSEALAPLVNIFSKDTTVAGNCAMDVNEETLKEFGLDDPDVVLTMTINGDSKTFKFSKLTGNYAGYCAIVYDGAKMIRLGNTQDFAFLTTSTETYYYKSLFMVSINDITSLSIKTADTDLNFDIKANENDATTNSPYIAKFKGKDVTKGFRSYYSDFTCIQCSNFEISETSGTPDATITFKFSEDEDTVVTMYSVNANEYQYSINGIAMGRIPSSEYNKFIKNFKTISEGKEITQ